MQAIWNGKVIAQSDETVVVESNHYFPRSSLADECFSQSNKSTHCPWKGDATYLSVTVEGEVNTDAAWFYASPKDAAKEIAGMVSFWRGVKVS
jgi:uncharacterized protein (DUF427 family)